MLNKQIYDIQASFLVPAYNLPSEMNSWYITTQQGRHDKGSIFIDVWLIRAQSDDPVQSMVASLQAEEKAYQTGLKKAQTNEKSAENDKKIAALKHGVDVFSKLIIEANDTVYHKRPDDEFLKIANNNMTQPSFAKYRPDVKNYLYLAGLSRYQEQ